MAPISKRHPLYRWFAGLVETSFQSQIGLAEPALLDYITELLTEFIHMERINELTDGSGRRIEEVARMLAEAEIGAGATDENRRRSMHRHIGDFTLFWTGLYPENLRRMRRRRAKDELISYLDQGKRSYAIASDLSDGTTKPPAKLLSTLSSEFECCVYGLGLVRRQWEQGGPGSFPPATIIWS